MAFSVLDVTVPYAGQRRRLLVLSVRVQDRLRCPPRVTSPVTPAASLGSAMARHAGPRLPLIVKNLIPTLSSVFDSQRVTTAAFFAEVSARSSVRPPLNKG